jgi:hypothetical protein
MTGELAMPGIDSDTKTAGELAGALQDMLRQMLDKIMGAPAKGKGGEPLRDVCVMVLPTGTPIEPKDFSYPWDPAGGDADEERDDVKTGVAPKPPAPGAPPAPPDIATKLAHAYQSAENTALLFNSMMRVTDDGTYRPFTSAGSISSAYEGIIVKAQGIPAPPPPADIQKKIDESLHLLYVFDDKGQQKGKTQAFQQYQRLKLA